MNRNILRLCKNDGKFVLAYNDDAYILHSIFNYKLVREGTKDKCGFPSTIIDKIIEKLEELNISYEIYYKNTLESIKDYKKKNTYEKHLKDALIQVEIDKKIDLIKYKLSRLPLENVNKQLETMLNTIE
ncbi:MAG: hypothetical protein PUD34_00585 [bacterium]|nr:hypothetical protein [bacterium]